MTAVGAQGAGDLFHSKVYDAEASVMRCQILVLQWETRVGIDALCLALTVFLEIPAGLLSPLPQMCSIAVRELRP